MFSRRFASCKLVITPTAEPPDNPYKRSSVTTSSIRPMHTGQPTLWFHAYLSVSWVRVGLLQQPAIIASLLHPAEWSPEAMSSAAHKQLTAGSSLDGLGLGQVMAPLPDVQLGPTWQEASPRAVAQQQSSAVKAGVDLTAGTLAGVAQLVVGYPFDTIKVRQELLFHLLLQHASLSALLLSLPCFDTACSKAKLEQYAMRLTSLSTLNQRRSSYKARAQLRAAKPSRARWMQQSRCGLYSATVLHQHSQATAKPCCMDSQTSVASATLCCLAVGHAATAGPGCLLLWCFRCLLQTLVNEGIKGIYKGISAPLATVALFNAVLFASRGQMEVLLKHADGESCVLSPAGTAGTALSCSGPANPLLAAVWTVCLKSCGCWGV